MNHGYMGRILEVDLSKEKISLRTFDEKILRMFLGGLGLASKIISDELNVGINPLDEKNKIVFMTGPLTGTVTPTSSRYVVCSLSPLTGIWGEANAGGFWGPELKFAGYDGLIVRGRAKNPVFLYINDEDVEIRDALHLWGRDSYETEDILKKDFGKKFKVACIGQAGENLVKISAIMNDMGRAAARTGLGAVMGSKNLKAIAVRGSKKVEMKDKDKAKEIQRKLLKIIRESSFAKSLHENGTDGVMETLEYFGDVPVKFWRLGTFENVEKISGETITKTILKGTKTCFSCPIACKREVEVKEGKYKVSGSGPEYETCASFGTLLLNDDLKSIAFVNDLCNRYGLDTISTGSVVGFAMECFEKGIISLKDLGGIDLTWGNADSIIECVKKIAFRRDFGNVLAEGVFRASKKLGRRAVNFSIHVKGLEIPLHDPRAFESWALSYATTNRGACHITAPAYWVERGITFSDIGLDKRMPRFETEGKAFLVKTFQDFCTTLESVIVCKLSLYGGVTLTHISELLKAIVGFDYTVEELLKVGERINNLIRNFNVKLGVTKKQDTLPKRILNEPHPSGGAKGHLPNLPVMLEEYYKLRGWNENGIPKTETLKKLGL
ncbi:MAG: aldehyde ferredoxin oxidoreductase family protein [Candidatus Methanofastidiosia archaeon]